MPTARSHTSVTAVLRSACLAVLILVATIGTRTPALAGDHGRIILGTVAQTRQESEERERETGRHLTGVRVFRRWDQPLIDADQRWAQKTGHTVFLSIKSRRADRSAVAWRELANAPAGSALAHDMLRQAAEIKRFGSLVYIAFNHEPDARASRSMGGPADFIAAWRRLVTTYRAAGVTNARYVWTMTDWAFGRGAYSYYPGDAYVDDIAADVYNWYTCRGQGGPWKSLAELIEPQRRFGLRHPQQGLMLLEWGSVEDPARPGRKAQWIRDATRLFSGPAYRQYKAILHWDDRHSGLMAGTSCDFDYRTSPSALAAWREMAASPVFATEPSCAGGHCAAGRSRILSAQIGGGAAAVAVAAFTAFEYRRRRTRGPGP
jgi:hypothetical protein